MEFAGTQKFIQTDSSEVTVRDPGDRLWGEVFDYLVARWVYKRTAAVDLPQLSDDRKWDVLELLLGAASIVLDRGEQVHGPSPSWHLQYCLYLVRLLVEDLAQTLEEIHVALHLAGCLLKALPPVQEAGVCPMAICHLDGCRKRTLLPPLRHVNAQYGLALASHRTGAKYDDYSVQLAALRTIST